MNYNEISLTDYNFDTEFTAYINSYQDIYKYKVLQKTTHSLKIKNTEKKDIKKILEDFFFTPKYNNVLDVLKFGKN